mgnify:FL=1
MVGPHQVKIIPVSQDKHGDYAKQINDQLRKLKIRSSVETRGEKMGYLIRDAQTHKIPYTLVVGDEEVNGKSVSVRRYGEQDTQSESLDAFVDEIQKDIASYSRND